MSVSLQALVSGNPTGPVVYALAPGPDDRERAGCLEDVPHHPPAYHTEALPLPGAVPRPPGELGVIRWPCWGLSRFAAGHLLLRAADLRSLEAVAGWDSRVRVTLSDGVTSPAPTLAMRVAAARPLADSRAVADEDLPGTSGPEMLHVVTLADFRADFAATPWSSVGAPFATWGDALNGLITHYGLTAPSASSVNTMLALHAPAYPVPPQRWNRGDQSGSSDAVLIDATAAAVNLRVVFSPDNTVSVQDAATAGTAWQAWLAAYGGRFEKGGLIDGDRELPVGVNAAFGTSSDFAAVTGGRWGVIGVELADTGAVGTNGDWVDRYADDVERWATAGWPTGAGWGYPPLPASGCPFLVSYHTAGGFFTLDRDPVWHPWVLAGRRPTLAVGQTATTTGLTSGSFTAAAGTFVDVPAMTITAAVGGTYAADYTVSGSVTGNAGGYVSTRLVVNGSVPTGFGGESYLAVCQVAAVTALGTACGVGSITLAAGDVVKVQAARWNVGGGLTTALLASTAGNGMLRLARR